MRIQRALGDYNGGWPFQAYALTIAKRYCIDRLRHENVERRLVVVNGCETITCSQMFTKSRTDSVRRLRCRKSQWNFVRR